MGRSEGTSESGQTLVEYAAALGVIALGCILALTFFGGSVERLLGSSGDRAGALLPPLSGTLPTTTEECEDGGWRNYPQFSSEAACKEYVEGLGP